MLTFPVAHLLERRLVPEGVFARLYDEGKPRGDRLDRLCGFLLLGGGHRVGFLVSEREKRVARTKGIGNRNRGEFCQSLEFGPLFVPAKHSHGHSIRFISLFLYSFWWAPAAGALGQRRDEIPNCCGNDLLRLTGNSSRLRGARGARNAECGMRNTCMS